MDGWEHADPVSCGPIRTVARLVAESPILWRESIRKIRLDTVSWATDNWIEVEARRT